jgi:hypothetical protein
MKNVDWQRVRFWVYTTLVAAAPLIVWYGVATSAEVAMWLTALEVVIGGGLARTYSSSRVAVTRIDPAVNGLAG